MVPSSSATRYRSRRCRKHLPSALYQSSRYRCSRYLRDKRRELEHIFAGKLYVTQSSFDIVECLHPNVSKGHALSLIAADLGIAPGEIIAIGDNHNDIGMLRFAGLGVAMGKAHAEVKAEANHAQGRNTEEGVAMLIEEMILPQLA